METSRIKLFYLINLYVAGSVIKAWDIGVATMKRGEVCVLTCAPEYAYGAAGSPPKIPPNATLQFEVYYHSININNTSN